MYKIFIGLMLSASVYCVAMTMENPRVSTPEIDRRRLEAIQHKLNQLGRKFVHVMGTDKEDGVKKEMEQLEKEKDNLSQKFGVSPVYDDELGIRKISVQQKVDTLREFFVEPVYPEVTVFQEECETPTSDSISPVQSNASETTASSLDQDQAEPQFVPDDTATKAETLAQQKKLFSSIVAAKKQAPCQKPKSLKPNRSTTVKPSEDNEDFVFAFDDMPSMPVKQTKKMPIPKSPVTPLHVAKLYKKARFGSV